MYNGIVCLASGSQTDKILAPNRKKYEDEMEAVMNEIKEKDALLVSFVPRNTPEAVVCFR